MRLRPTLSIMIILAITCILWVNHSWATALKDFTSTFRQVIQEVVMPQLIKYDMSTIYGFPILNVKKDFGATGDGKTDDTINIQKALNSGSGKSVYLPTGTYLISNKLTFPNNVNIIGDGIGKTKIIIQNGGSILKSTNHYSNVKISNISFIGNKTGNNSLLDVSNISNLSIQNCSFEKSGAACILICYSSDVIINNCTVTEGSEPGWGGGIALGTVNGITITNCNIYNNEGCGIAITSANGPSCNFKIVSNKCLNNTVAGIAITGNSYTGEVRNNTCNNNGGTSIATGMQDGINLHRVRNVVVENNICNNNAHHGIGMNGRDSGTNTSCQYVDISGNTCTENKEQGIYLFYTQYCTVDNNTCLKNECTEAMYAGILLVGSAYNKITNNRSHDNGVVGGSRCSDIAILQGTIQTDAGYNHLNGNAVGAIERTDEENSIVIKTVYNYIGAIDYTHFKWGATPGKTPIYISDLINQEYSTDIVKTVDSKEFTLSNSTNENDFVFLGNENARIIDAKIIYTEATSPDPGVKIKLGTPYDDICFGVQTTEGSNQIDSATTITLVGNKQLTAGTWLCVHSDNKKTGAGKIKVRVRLMIPMYYV